VVVVAVVVVKAIKGKEQLPRPLKAQIQSWWHHRPR